MIQLIQKLSTAMRGGTREMLETAVDANALRILSQEIYECEASLRESKEHLAKVIAEKLSLKRQLDTQNERIAKADATLRQQLADGHQDQAMQLAQELADLENRRDKQQSHYEQLLSYEQSLLQVLKNTAYTLGQYRTELGMARATEQTHKTLGKLSTHKNQYSENFSRIQDSLQRIRQRQQDFGDQMQAMDEIDAYLKGEPDAADQRRQKAEDILSRYQTSETA